MSPTPSSAAAAAADSSSPAGSTGRSAALMFCTIEGHTIMRLKPRISSLKSGQPTIQSTDQVKRQCTKFKHESRNLVDGRIDFQQRRGLLGIADLARLPACARVRLHDRLPLLQTLERFLV